MNKQYVINREYTPDKKTSTKKEAIELIQKAIDKGHYKTKKEIELAQKLCELLWNETLNN